MSMVSEIHHRRTGEVLVVELEIGPVWWLRNQSDEIESAPIEHFAPEVWAFIGTSEQPAHAQAVC